MPREIVMPLLGSSMEEGYIVEWLKKEGETVSRGEPLLRVETDKAVLNAESHYTGTITEIMVQAGETVEVGTVIAILREEGEVEGSKRQDTRILASPLARKMARELKLDLKEINGTGPGGRIVKADIENYRASLDHQQDDEPRQFADLKKDKSDRTGKTVAREIPITRTRKKIADKTRNSKQERPHYYVSMEVELDSLLKLRQGLKESQLAISLNDLLIRAVALALNEYPLLNSSYREDRGVIEVYEEKNIGMIIGREEGVIIPVIRNADQLPVKEIAQITAGYKKDVAEGKVAPDDLSGGTFTISNLGMFGVSEFTAVINPPEAAILAVGGLQERVKLEGGELISARFFKLTLSLDHRVIDGVTGAQFLQQLKKLLENPFRLLV